MGDDEQGEVSAAHAARLLSVLLVTGEDDLDGYRVRMLGKESQVPTERLAALRTLLTRLGGVLLRDEDAQWDKVVAAKDALAPSMDASAGRVPDESVPARVGEPPRVPGAPFSAPPSSSPSSASPPSVRPAQAPPPPRAASPTINAGSGSVWARASPTAVSARPPESAGSPPQPAPSQPTPSPAPPEPVPPAAVAPPPAPAGSTNEDAPTAIHHLVDTLDTMKPGKDPLPFKQGSGIPNEVSRVLDQSAHEVSVNLGSTMGVGSMPTSSALPFPSLPQLTLEQYASLCAICAERPHLIAKTHADYGLPTPAMREALDSSFKQRFEGDPALEEKFNALVSEYRDWYRRNPSS